ncbi:MAG TPA: hypothetical protein VIK72_19215 [Clostridiaceae bacterium]
MVKTGKLYATATEQSIALSSNLFPTLILAVDADVEISINDNSNYQTYKTGETIPLQDRRDTFNKLYYKTLTGTSIVRYWLS